VSALLCNLRAQRLPWMVAIDSNTAVSVIAAVSEAVVPLLLFIIIFPVCVVINAGSVTCVMQACTGWPSISTLLLYCTRASSSCSCSEGEWFRSGDWYCRIFVALYTLYMYVICIPSFPSSTQWQSEQRRLSGICDSSTALFTAHSYEQFLQWTSQNWSGLV